MVETFQEYLEIQHLFSSCLDHTKPYLPAHYPSLVLPVSFYFVSFCRSKLRFIRMKIHSISQVFKFQYFLPTLAQPTFFIIAFDTILTQTSTLFFFHPHFIVYRLNFILHLQLLVVNAHDIVEFRLCTRLNNIIIQ